MNLAITLNPFMDSDLLYAQQLGVTWVVGDLSAWDYETLAAACNRVEKSGLYLSGLSCLPEHLLAEAILAKPTNVMAVDQVCRIITDAGKLGIQVLGYGLPFTQPGETANTVTGRGGALSVVYENHDREQSAQQDRREDMWSSLSDFLKTILPVAEAAGVRIAYRTDLYGASHPEETHILDSLNELDRLFIVAGSSHHGLDLDHGFLAQVIVPEVIVPEVIVPEVIVPESIVPESIVQQTAMKVDDVIQHFGLQNRIFAVRLRNLRRTDHGAQEFFLDEDRVDMIRALQAYNKSRFEGSLCPIPSPGMTDDSEWRHKGYAFSIGYLRGLLQAMC